MSKPFFGARLVRPARAVRPEPLDVTVDTSMLSRIGRRKSLPEYVAQLWRYRHFILEDSKARVETRNEGSALGNIWLVLTPVLNGLTYFLVFGLLLGTSRGIENFLGFLIIGVFMFSFTSRAVSNGARSIQQSRTMISAFRFPRATLPIAVNLRELLAFAPALVAMVVMIVVLPDAESITWRWLLVVPVVALQYVLNLGMSLLLAPIVANVTDVANLITFGMRIWLYASGVFYSYERFTENPQLLAVLELNPMHQVLDMIRDLMLYESLPDAGSWLVLAGWAAGLFLLGFVVFWRREERLGKEY